MLRYVWDVNRERDSFIETWNFTFVLETALKQVVQLLTARPLLCPDNTTIVVYSVHSASPKAKPSAKPQTENAAKST